MRLNKVKYLDEFGKIECSLCGIAVALATIKHQMKEKMYWTSTTPAGRCICSSCLKELKKQI